MPIARNSLTLAIMLGLFAHPVAAQHAEAPDYSRKNSFGIFSEYSNDSSRILLGAAQNRRLLGFGVSYQRRIVSAPAFEMRYMAEASPVYFVIDPLVHTNAVLADASGDVVQTSAFDGTQAVACRPQTLVFTDTPPPGSSNPVLIDTVTISCGRRQWTFSEGFSPLGLQVSLRPGHRVQPVFSILGGYLFSTRPVPVSNAGSFNYSFELGAGFEFFRAQESSAARFGHQSLRAEYRYHHLSNAYTAPANPGIDSNLIQLTYSFGK